MRRPGGSFRPWPRPTACSGSASSRTSIGWAEPLAYGSTGLYILIGTIRKMSPHPRPAAGPASAAVVTKAALRAATRLGMTAKVFATVVGLSEATVARMRAGDYQLRPGEKSFELALLFLRLYRSLDAIVSADNQLASPSLRNPTTLLDVHHHN